MPLRGAVIFYQYEYFTPRPATFETEALAFLEYRR